MVSGIVSSFHLYIMLWTSPSLVPLLIPLIGSALIGEPIIGIKGNQGDGEVSIIVIHEPPLSFNLKAGPTSVSSLILGQPEG